MTNVLRLLGKKHSGLEKVAPRAAKITGIQGFQVCGYRALPARRECSVALPGCISVVDYLPAAPESALGAALPLGGSSREEWNGGNCNGGGTMRLRSILSVAVLGILFAAGCARKPDDAAIVTNIKAQMFSDSHLKDANLQVTAKNGQITLAGTVPSDAARLDAYKIATQTPGVTKVTDQMTVSGAEASTPSAENAQTTQPSQPETAQANEPPPSQPAPEANSPVPSPAAASASAAKRAERERERRRKEREKKEQQVAQTDQDQQATSPADQNADQNPAAAPAPQPQDQSQSQQTPAAPAVQSAPPSVPAPAPAQPPPPPQPTQVQIPAGTTMSIRMIDGVDSSVNQPGEIFHASLDAPVVVGDQVVVPKDADVYVRLASSSSSGHFKGRSELHLELVKLEFQGQSYPLSSSTYSVSGASRGKDTAKKVGIGAVVGTVIGAVAGGGKGAAIGGAIGAGAGGGYQAATHGKSVKIASETKLDFQLEQPVTVTVMPHSGSSGQ
jgi:hypothetical protein